MMLSLPAAGRRRLRFLLGILAMTLPVLWSPISSAVQITAENDSVITSGDRHYTQGTRIALDPYRIREGASAQEQDANRANGLWLQWLLVGQQLYTPDHVERPVPDPADRPYAGWLYTGAALFNVSDRHYERYEGLVGIVGPSAGGEPLQNGFHRAFGYSRSEGWGYQLKDTPVGVLSAERGDRFPVFRWAGVEGSIITQAGVSAGNLFDDVHLAALLRAGNLRALPYGADQLRGSYNGLPRLSTTPETFGHWAVWAGAQQRAAFYNLLLEGTGGDSPHVPHRPLMTELLFGGALALPRGWALEVHASDRSEEFRGQDGHDKFFGFSFYTHW